MCVCGGGGGGGGVVTLNFIGLSISYLETHKRVIGEQCRPRSEPHYVASDQGLHCLLTGFSIKSTVKPVLVATSIKQATCIEQACSQFPKKGKYIEMYLY